jgi:hypothetical protein
MTAYQQLLNQAEPTVPAGTASLVIAAARWSAWPPRSCSSVSASPWPPRLSGSAGEVRPAATPQAREAGRGGHLGAISKVRPPFWPADAGGRDASDLFLLGAACLSGWPTAAGYSQP